MRAAASLCAALPFIVAACAPRGETAVNDSAANAAPPAVDVAAVRQAIEQGNAKFAMALQQGDTAAMVSAYTDDAIVMPQGEPAWNGRAAIATGAARMLQAVRFGDVKLATSNIDIAGDYAIETGTFEWTVTPKGGKPAPDKGKYLTVWKKQADGSWKLFRDIFNTDMAPKS